MSSVSDLGYVGFANPKSQCDPISSTLPTWSAALRYSGPAVMVALRMASLLGIGTCPTKAQSGQSIDIRQRSEKGIDAHTL